MSGAYLQYISTEGLGVLSQTCLITLGFGYLSHCLIGADWIDIVLRHGFLVALLAIGRCCYYSYRLLSPRGTSTTGKSSDFMSSYSQQLTAIITLGGSFVLMSLTNRYGLIALAYVIIGYTSTAVLGDLASPLTNKYGLGGDFDCHAASVERNGPSGSAELRTFPTESERLARSKGNAKLSIYTFSIAALLTGLFYSEDKLDSKPAFRPFFLICVGCLLLSASLVATNQKLFHRRASCVGRCVSVCISIFGFLLTAISTLLMPLTEYFPSLQLGEEGAGGLASGCDTPRGSGSSSRSGDIHPAVGEKDLLLDVFNKLTGESDERTLEIYPGPVPSTFVNVCGGDVEKGRAAFSKCLRWRRTYHMDLLINTPQHDFFEILQMSPHVIHGISLDGCAVVYECLNKAKNHELKRRGLSPEKLVRHFMMRNEFIFKRIYNNQDLLEIANEGYRGPPAYAHKQPGYTGGPSGAGGGKHGGPHAAAAATAAAAAGHVNFVSGDEWKARSGVFTYCPQRLMTIVDVKDISYSDITTDSISFIRQSGEIMDKYYPEVVERLVIINAPSWFWTVWRLVSNVIPESVQKKIQIFYDSANLDKFIHPSQRPEEYGGTGAKLGEGEDHRRFLKIVEEWEASSGNRVLRFHEIEEANAKALAEAAQPRLRARTLSRGIPASSRTGAAGAKTGGGQGGSGAGGSVANTNANSNANASGGPSGDQGGGGGGGGSGWGWGSWWRSRFGGQGRGGATVAYMQDENSFRYDKQLGRWVLSTGMYDDSEAEGEGEGLLAFANGGEGSVEAEAGPKISEYQRKGRQEERGLRQGKVVQMTQEKLEEHGLVLAIQAAELASNISKTGASPRGKGPRGAHFSEFGTVENGSANARSRGGGEAGDRWRVQQPQQQQQQANAASGAGGAGGSGAGAGGDDAPTYASLEEYLAHQSLRYVSRVCGAVFLSAGCLLSGLTCTVPVWLMSPLSVGGKGYSVLDLACVFACSGLIAIQCHVQCRWRLRRVAQVSPVRSLRIAAGALTIALLLLPCIGSEYTWIGIGSDSPEAFKPSSTMFAVPVPALVIVFAAWAGHYLRQAAECLFLLSRNRLIAFEWRHQLSQPAGSASSKAGDEAEYDFFPDVLSSSSDIFGPVALSWLLVSTHGWSYQFPMDAGFFLPACASVGILLYATSLCLALQFVGDFGVIPDDPAHEVGMGALGDIFLLLGRSAHTNASTFVGSRLFNLDLSISAELKEV